MVKKYKEGVALDKIDKILSELTKQGIYIPLGEFDAKLFGEAGKLKIKSMDCTLFFFEKEKVKESKELCDQK